MLFHRAYISIQFLLFHISQYLMLKKFYGLYLLPKIRNPQFTSDLVILTKLSSSWKCLDLRVHISVRTQQRSRIPHRPDSRSGRIDCKGRITTRFRVLMFVSRAHRATRKNWSDLRSERRRFREKLVLETRFQP